jgi:hypothetical protein
VQFLASLFAAFLDVERKVEGQLADGVNNVVTCWTATGTHQGEFMGIAPTGRQFTISGITIDCISGGKIIEEGQQWDSLGLMQQLGVIPTLHSGLRRRRRESKRQKRSLGVTSQVFKSPFHSKLLQTAEFSQMATIACTGH